MWFLVCNLLLPSLLYPPSLSPCPRSPHMLQVPSRCTLETPTPNSTICHPHTSSMCVYTEERVCSGFRSGHRPRGHSDACPLWRECVHVCTFMLSSHVCGYRICVFLHAHLRHVAPGRALSRPQESLWERVREGCGECVCISCQMDLCPSRLRLAPGPWQKIRTESFYKEAADSVQTEPN